MAPRGRDYRVDDVPHAGKLSTKVKLWSISSLLLGCTAVVLAFVITTLKRMPDAFQDVEVEMVRIEERNLNRMTGAKATYATESLARVVSDIELLQDFAQAALLGNFSGSASRSTNGMRGSQTCTPEVLPPYRSSDKLSRSQCSARSNCRWLAASGECASTINKDVSSYILPGRSGSEYDWDGVTAKPAAMPSHTKDRLDQMAALDMVFFSLRNQYGNDDGTLLYYGLEDYADGEARDGHAAESIYRTYPGEDMTSYSSWGAKHAAAGSPKWCDARWTPAAGSAPASWPTRAAPADAEHRGTQRQAAWYDPRCRGWYQDAKAAGGVIFTSPYTDSNTGKLVMSAAAPIYSDAAKTELAGVVAIDFSVADLDESILVNGRVLEEGHDGEGSGAGYSYVMAADGGAVIHPRLNRDEGAISIAELEVSLSDDPAGFTAFQTIATRVRNGCRGATEYTKHGDSWVMAYAPETAVGTGDCVDHGFGYAIGMTVSEAAVLKPFADLESAIAEKLSGAIVVVAALVGIGVLIMGCIAVAIGDKTARPVSNLYGMLTKLNNRETAGDGLARTASHVEVNELLKDIDAMLQVKADSPELHLLMKAFRQMVVIVSASNVKLGDGDYKGAIQSFTDALGVFKSINNQKGIGICCNNIAICYYNLAGQEDRARNLELA